MKKLILSVLMVLLAGCGAPTFDASSEKSVEESGQKISEELPKDQQTTFQKAVGYYAIGGKDGMKTMISAAMSGKQEQDPKQLVLDNLKAIDGLTGEEIIEKYQADKAQ